MSRSVEYSKSKKIKLNECKNFNKKKLKIQKIFYRLNCIRDDYNNKIVNEITRTKLINKCKERNIELRLVDTFYPSSKTCSCCGNIKKNLKLKDRIYKCDKCGLEIDRDLNASINLKNAKIYKVMS